MSVWVGQSKKTVCECWAKVNRTSRGIRQGPCYLLWAVVFTHAHAYTQTHTRTHTLRLSAKAGGLLSSGIIHHRPRLTFALILLNTQHSALITLPLYRYRLSSFYAPSSSLSLSLSFFLPFLSFIVLCSSPLSSHRSHAPDMTGLLRNKLQRGHAT